VSNLPLRCAERGERPAEGAAEGQRGAGRAHGGVQHQDHDPAQAPGGAQQRVGRPGLAGRQRAFLQLPGGQRERVARPGELRHEH